MTALTKDVSKLADKHMPDSKILPGVPTPAIVKDAAKAIDKIPKVDDKTVDKITKTDTTKADVKDASPKKDDTTPKTDKTENPSP